jgi:hypothetical protein
MFELRDEATNAVIVMIGQRAFKFMGFTTIGWNVTGGAQSGTITDPRFTQYPGSEPAAFPVNGGFDTRGAGAQLSISGNTLTWRYPYAEGTQQNRQRLTFMYGFF